MKNLIIFVHGAFCSNKSWNYLRPIIDIGLADSVSDVEMAMFEYDVTTTKTEDIVDELVSSVKDFISDYDKVWFIAHSYGGVISIASIRKLLLIDENLAVEAITLATPFGGSEAASMMIGMKPSSIFIRNVGAYGRYMMNFKRQPLPCKVTAIVTHTNKPWCWIENDGVVTVDSEMHYESDPNFVAELRNISHTDVVLSEEVGSFIVDKIALENVFVDQIIVGSGFLNKFMVGNKLLYGAEQA